MGNHVVANDQRSVPGGPVRGKARAKCADRGCIKPGLGQLEVILEAGGLAMFIKEVAEVDKRAVEMSPLGGQEKVWELVHARDKFRFGFIRDDPPALPVGTSLDS